MYYKETLGEDRGCGSNLSITKAVIFNHSHTLDSPEEASKKCKMPKVHPRPVTSGSLGVGPEHLFILLVVNSTGHSHMLQGLRTTGLKVFYM